MNYIPTDLVDRIKQQMGPAIERVISEHQPLKKAGKSYTGACPFCGSKSFTVTPGIGIYKCFKCGAAGNPIKYLMEAKKQTYPEALKSLQATLNLY